MRPSLAALAAVAAATTIGGAPAPVTHVERRSIHHKYTPCNPTPHTVEQAPMPPRGCRNAEETSRAPNVALTGRTGPSYSSTGGRSLLQRATAREPPHQAQPPFTPIAQSQAAQNPTTAPRQCCVHHGSPTHRYAPPHPQRPHNGPPSVPVPPLPPPPRPTNTYTRHTARREHVHYLSPPPPPPRSMLNIWQTLATFKPLSAHI